MRTMQLSNCPARTPTRRRSSEGARRRSGPSGLECIHPGGQTPAWNIYTPVARPRKQPKEMQSDSYTGGE